MTFNEQLKILINSDISKIRAQLVERKELLQNSIFKNNLTSSLLKLILDTEKSYLKSEQYDKFTKALNAAKDFNKLIDLFYDYIEANRENLKYKINLWTIVIIEMLYELISINREAVKFKEELISEVYYRLFMTKNEYGSMNQKYISNENIDSKSYPLLFAFSIRQTAINDIEQFLNYHKTGNIDNYIKLLKNIIIEYDELLSNKTKLKVNEWLEKYENQTIYEGTDNNERNTDKKIQGQKTIINKDLLDINEASEYLNLSKSTIYGKTSNNTIPYYKRGKKLYFKKSELDRWILSHKKHSNDELQEKAENYIFDKKI